MDYIVINRIIYQYFITDRSSKGEYLLLNFDEADLEEVSKRLDLTTTQVLEVLKSTLSKDWTPLVEEVAGVPLYFGLIAFQSYAAYLMEKDELFTENAFLPKFKSLLGKKGVIIDDGIKNLFVGSGIHPIQDVVWGSAKAHLEKLGFLSNIPLATTHSWRYVRYPKSQSLLNTADLKRLTPFFILLNLRPNELITFEDFKLLIERESSLSAYLSNHAKKVFKNTVEQTILYQQIFNFYQHWDGTINGQPKEVQKKNLNSSLLLAHSAGNYKIYIGENENFISPKQLFQQLKKLNCKSIHSNLILFKNIPQYPNEYEDIRYLDIGQQVIVFVDKNRHPALFGFLAKSGADKDFGNMAIFHLETNKGHLDTPLGEYIKPFPLRLKNGLRIGRFNEWMLGAGPNLEVIDSVSDIWINDEKLTLENGNYSFKNFSVGNYVIKIKGYTQLNFSIIDDEFKYQVSDIDFQKSWGLNEWILTMDALNITLNGLQFHEEQSSTKHPVRSWINKLKNSNKNVRSTLIAKYLQKH